VQRSRPLLAATLIVRDEAHQLAECLATLADVVDEIVVYDTGSLDGTRDLARAAGARVLAGYWDDDFARARNAAFAMTRAWWALAVDADERLVADGSALRSLLADARATPLAGILVRVVSLDGRGRFQSGHHSLRLTGTRGARWHGRVHEVLVPADGPRVPLPADVARIEHLGYPDAGTIRAKAERNLALAQLEVDRLFASRSQDRSDGTRVLLDLARSALELGRRQLAVDALEAVREIAPAGPQRAQGTAMLAQTLLDAGGFEEVGLVLEAELRADPCVDSRLADWIRAQAVAGLGRPEEALDLLRGVGRLLDPAGVDLPLDRVLRARAALAAGLGHLGEARAVLLEAVLDHGAVAGSGQLLRAVFADPQQALEAVLERARATGRDRWLPEVEAELAQDVGTMSRPA
jgi:tetratricopeptide (TPR) repeat protein